MLAKLSWHFSKLQQFSPSWKETDLRIFKILRNRAAHHGVLCKVANCPFGVKCKFGICVWFRVRRSATNFHPFFFFFSLYVNITFRNSRLLWPEHEMLKQQSKLQWAILQAKLSQSLPFLPKWIDWNTNPINSKFTYKLYSSS